MASSRLDVPLAESLRRSTENLTELLAATETLNKSTSEEILAEALEEDPLEFSPELGDIEFDLPVVDDLPTLESILSEQNDVPDSPDVQLIMEQKGSSKQAAFDSRSNRPVGRQSKTVHGSVLRNKFLKGVSKQMTETAHQSGVGLPTAMSVRMVIAIGTSHGVVLVFDTSQALKWVLGDIKEDSQYGAISALDINQDSSRLLCGYAKGQLTMWDLDSGKCLRIVTDAHPPGYAVIQVAFTDDSTCGLFSDSMGSVYLMNFKRKLGMRSTETKCMFSGSRGEVCTMAPLHMTLFKKNPLSQYSLVALATFSKVLLISTSPRLEVLFSHPLTGDAASLPLLDWFFVIIQTDKGRVVNPVLAFARSNLVMFDQISSEDKHVVITHLRSMKLPYKVASLKWINAQIVVFMDTLEHFHVVDVKSEEELEVIDMSSVELIYSSSFFKSLATGGNVSKALASAGRYACYQSVVSNAGEILVLGWKAVHVLSLRKWEERLNYMLREERFLDALSLALTFYNGTAKAVVGLDGDRAVQQAAVVDQLMTILIAYVELSLSTNRPHEGGRNELVLFFQSVVQVCIDYCLAVDQTDILFSDLYNNFVEDPVGKSVFLQCLEPYILADKLRSLSPIVLKDFVELYQERDKLQAVEKCLVHMDVANLDLHQMVILCWTYGLYDAMIYVYNRGMNDYVTPLEELLRLLRAAAKPNQQLSTERETIGYKVLVYINCCFAGRGYPTGSIPDNKKMTVKSDVYNVLIAKHTRDAVDDESTYPNLKTLLKFDPREFLNVLSLAFDEREFDDQPSRAQLHGPNRQEVVNILLALMVSTPGSRAVSEVGYLFTFLARQLARHGQHNLHISSNVFDQMIVYLTNSDDDSRHEERQQSLLDMLVNGILKQYGKGRYDEDKLLMLAENAKFFRVLEMLYEQRRQLAKILSCYLRDPVRKKMAFAYIHGVMTSDDYVNFERQEVEQAALASLPELVAIDCEATARLVLMDFAHDIMEVVHRLQGYPQVLYEFLQGVFESKAGFAVSKADSPPPPDVHEQYIELMCIYKPTSVFNYLRRCDTYFRLEQTLAMCEKHKVKDAQAHLLEKTGAVREAFDLILETLKKHIRTVLEAYRNGEDSHQALQLVNTTLMVIIQLCLRNSSLKQREREYLWFSLLDVVMGPCRDLREQPRYQKTFKDLMQQVLNSLVGHVSLASVLQKILQDPTYQGRELKEVRELILDMLETYNYEKTLLETTNHLLATDNHVSLRQLVATTSRGKHDRNRATGSKAAGGQEATSLYSHQIQAAVQFHRESKTSSKIGLFVSAADSRGAHQGGILQDPDFDLKLVPVRW